MEDYTWKSPRRIELEVNAYRSKRFEDYMLQVDSGELTQAIALSALREEIEYQEVSNGEATTVNHNQVAQS